MKNNKIIGLCGLIFAVSLMIGCSAKVDVQNNSTANTNSASGGQKKGDESVKNGNTAEEKPKTDDSSANSDKIESVYTDITPEKCKTTGENEQEEWRTQMCDGVGGYKLEVFEGDLRSSINVISPSGKKSELNFQANVSFNFSALGDKAEWRVQKKDGKNVPIALIVRLNASRDDDETKSDSFLTVSKINGDKACVTDVVKPIANANEEARKLADKAADKPCKTN